MLKQILIVLGILLVFGCADVSKENQLQTGCSGDSESTPENVYVPPAPSANAFFDLTNFETSNFQD